PGGDDLGRRADVALAARRLVELVPRHEQHVGAGCLERRGCRPYDAVLTARRDGGGGGGRGGRPGQLGEPPRGGIGRDPLRPARERPRHVGAIDGERAPERRLEGGDPTGLVGERAEVQARGGQDRLGGGGRRRGQGEG